MASFGDIAAPRKRIATYGKVARRRIPEYTVTAFEHPSRISDEKPDYDQPVASSIPSNGTGLENVPLQQKSFNHASQMASSSFEPPPDNETAPSKLSIQAPKQKRLKVKEPILPSGASTVAASTKLDIFDIPGSDEDTSSSKQRLHSKPPSAIRATAKQQLKSKTASSGLPSESSIYDFPSGIDEHAPPLKQTSTKPQAKTTITSKEKGPVSQTIPATSARELPNIKKRKLYTKVDTVETVASTKKVTAAPRSRLASKSSRGNIHPKEASKTVSATPVASNGIEEERRPQVSASRKAISSPTHSSTSTTASTQRSGSDAMDIDKPAIDQSPRGLAMWNGLLDLSIRDDSSRMDQDVFEADMVTRQTQKVARLTTSTDTSKGEVKSLIDRSRRLPRRRLIDSLVEQSRDHNMDEDSSDDELETGSVGSSVTNSTISEPALGYPDLPNQSSNLSATAPSSQGSQNVGPKFTYSRQRSMLAEEDFMQQLEFDMPIQPTQLPKGKRPRRGSVPKLVPLPSFDEEDDDEDGMANKAVRSVHELRQAGANNRFLDEVEDLLERIGRPTNPPSSMRRGALIELATKMNDKNFLRQFHSNGVEQRLFLHLGQETDIISGFLIVTLLIIELAEAAMPHIVAQLRRQGITKLLIRLLNYRESIVYISKERKTNMSKNSQNLVVELHDSLLQLPLWEDLHPQRISPRMASLKCLELMVRQTREAGDSRDIFSKEMISSLFDIVQSESDDSVWDLSNGNTAIDFYLALSSLEWHSISSRNFDGEAVWIEQYLPIVAKSIESSLAQPPEQFGVSQILILRLILNVTNNNPKASDVLANGMLMGIVGQAINNKFRKISKFLTEDEFSLVVDHLILLLGVMINFAEWSSNARERLKDLQNTEHDPMDAMIQLFVDYKGTTSLADSVQESQRNVAFGYLSVLLGYLSLLPAIADRIRNRLPRKSLKPLLESIEEFIGHHKAVDDLTQPDEEGRSSHVGLTERLQALVDRLSSMA
ncbi:wings apart-like protein regulation of heterochromatin-domain-containing protein [Xylogone sp. PMI_703]|nr:wings apart-like protein regulation of heterochromatin-domain-containing protein [Xylogone sp. PMI_703]